MTLSMFSRFVNVRNVMNVNNFCVAGGGLNIIQRSDIILKSYSSAIDYAKESDDEALNNVKVKPVEKKLSKAMAAYLQRSKDYKKFIEKEIAEYNIGKRHLAKMMGQNLDEFTQRDVHDAISYLFPSGIYDSLARPLMDHPNKLYQTRKEAEFDETGRPYHFLFYTTKPNYYEVLHKIADSLVYLNKMEDKKLAMNILQTTDSSVDLTGSEWLLKAEIEKLLLERLLDRQYYYLITSLTRLCHHPLSKHVAPFIMTYRKILTSITENITVPQPEYDSNNRPFIVTNDCYRKKSRGEVKVIGNGSGKITINGQDITYFSSIQCREQIIFPLILTNMSDKVDVEATVYDGGPSGQAGVIRQGISIALRSFVDKQMIEKMRLAGLLSPDWRRRERKKWGQEGARRKFTWKKR